MRIGATALGLFALLTVGGQGFGPAGNTAVDRLNEQLMTGRTQLQFEGRSGYLRDLLHQLHIPLDSQVVTFSQASLHGADVTEEYPRAIFFSDDIAVAWTPRSSTVELTAWSPQRGVVFYTLDQVPHQRARFEERRECVACHRSDRTLGVPGLLVLSASRTSGAAPITTDHRTPLPERWGDWYVTGMSRRWRHQGNRIGQGWLASLYDQFDTTPYPTMFSDVVALMVLEHQARASNLISRLRQAFDSGRIGLDAAAAATELADYLTFADEAPLPAMIVGTSGFAERFSSRVPRDSSGRSLFQLDLKRRLFRYSLSYMIYSAQFDALPLPAQRAVYERLFAGLTARGEFETLDILTATKPNIRHVADTH
jgi:hypothetical protein